MGWLASRGLGSVKGQYGFSAARLLRGQPLSFASIAASNPSIPAAPTSHSWCVRALYYPIFLPVAFKDSFISVSAA